ncbi:MAG: 3-dehydroquinate synthase [Clostridia bacterium]|nr:3-dehydroquinate synthase [Clostridia bacterium]
MAGRVKVNLGDRSYYIHCGVGLLAEAGRLLKPLKLAAPCLVVSNPTVAELYWPQLEQSLREEGWQPHLTLVPDGEEAKSLKVAAELYDACLAAGIERGAAIMALGGGVTGDVAGFVAATWLRGIAFIQLPTTLLAQVDASVGGKVAVNHPRGKNLIGAFYQPAAVIADLDTLATLPPREMRAGLAEVIKYGVIADAAFFEYLEENIEKILTGDRELLERVVLRCCAIKAEIVAADERENDLRAILNFGHSLGHAFEAVGGYSTYNHGEAVALGMVAAARLAVRRSSFSPQESVRLVNLLQRTGLPVDLPPLKAQALLAALELDKKMRHGRLRMVIPERLGQVKITLVALEEILPLIS